MDDLGRISLTRMREKRYKKVRSARGGDKREDERRNLQQGVPWQAGQRKGKVEKVCLL